MMKEASQGTPSKYGAGTRSALDGARNFWDLHSWSGISPDRLMLGWAELRSSRTWVAGWDTPLKYGAKALRWAGQSSEPLGCTRLARYSPYVVHRDARLGRAQILQDSGSWLGCTPEIWCWGLVLGWAELAQNLWDPCGQPGHSPDGWLWCSGLGQAGPAWVAGVHSQSMTLGPCAGLGGAQNLRDLCG